MFASPSLFFTPADVPALRERIQRPEMTAVWQSILARAENHCDPEHPDYANPEDPFRARAKGDHVPDHRHKALMVHAVGRKLTDCMETVGFAYQITGREDFGKHGAAFLHAIATTYPSTREEVAKGFAGGRGDVMRGLALGYDWLGDALTETQRREVADSAAGYMDLFCKEFEAPGNWWYKVHNYNGVNGGAAGCLALTLSEAYPDRSGEWTERAISIIERWLSSGFGEDGAYFEGVGYSSYGLTNVALFADALRRADSPHDLYAHPLFDRLGTYYALSLLPGERVYDARNDSNYSGLGALLLGLAGSLDSGLYKWLWERSGSDRSFLRIVWHNDVVPVHPRDAGVPLARHFRDRGLCIWRTGWSADDVMFSVEAGPYYAVTHNQADKGHFNLYGLGYRWAVDTGYANERSPRGRGQTHAHSCILVDGKGQAISGAGLGTNGEIVTYDNNDRFGYALADSTEAYLKNNRDMPGAQVEFARRHTFFIYPKDDAPAYAIVLDDIRKDDQAHPFTWQMMIDRDMGVDIGQAGSDTRANTALLAHAEASGRAYVDSPWTSSDDAVASVAPGAQPPGEVAFDLEVPAAGRYTVWARVRTRADERGKADSFYVRMDDGGQVDWHMPPRSNWTWGKVTRGIKHESVTYDLDAGAHRLVFRRREPAAELDCVLVTEDAEQAPALPAAREAPLFFEAESGSISAPMRVVRTPESPVRMLVRVEAEGEVTLTQDMVRTEDYHGPSSFPLLRADTQAVNPRFCAVLAPLPAEMPLPKIRFGRAGAAREIRISWRTHEDVLLWPDDTQRPPLFR